MFRNAPALVDRWEYVFSGVFDLKATSMLQLQQTYRRTSEIGQTARCIEATSFTSSDPAMRERAHCLATRPPAMSPKCSGFAHPHSMGVRGSLFSARKNRKTRLSYPSFVWYKTVSVVELVALRRVAPRAAAQWLRQTEQSVRTVPPLNAAGLSQREVFSLGESIGCANLSVCSNPLMPDAAGGEHCFLPWLRVS